MKIIDRPHGGGKTTELVKFMLEPGNDDVIYIAPTNMQAQNARRIAEQLSGRPLPQSRFRRPLDGGGFPSGPYRFVVDEADSFFDRRVVAVALTGDDNKVWSECAQRWV